MTTPATDIGSRDLRPQLADRINAAVRGEITYITNHGRRVAAIVSVSVAEAAEAAGDTSDQAGAVVGALRDAAEEINALPQDFELDPGRGECADLLRARANAYGSRT